MVLKELTLSNFSSAQVWPGGLGGALQLTEAAAWGTDAGAEEAASQADGLAQETTPGRNTWRCVAV